ncbi:MAG TPA: hypothetical protein VGF32_04325 [Streptosporangiaceae bacterium]
MHDLVVRDLEQARNRTLGLTDAQLTAQLFDFGRSGSASSSVTWAIAIPDARLNLLLTDGR